MMIGLALSKERELVFLFFIFLFACPLVLVVYFMCILLCLFFRPCEYISDFLY